MKTPLETVIVQLPGHAPIHVNYFCSDDELKEAALIDLHLYFKDKKQDDEIHLMEAIQRKAVRQQTMMQVIIAEIVQEYVRHHQA